MDIKPTVTRMPQEIGSTASSNQKSANTSAPTKSADASSGNAADLTLTNAAQNLLDLQSAAEQVEDMDIAKVEALRQAIEDGSYEVNSAKIADKLIESSLELP